ncbi:MAG: tRNA uridine-5-carboxymethylaminomethyl(34) synthesis enzyme MnmG [Calditrichia bacterium]|nr:tRNA uridine-5-carboxymethylaminomethyl(34) synthesis enzyme MnmG [Calditrichia bacterium]
MKFDVIVAGGGHAGIEAAAASARMGMKTALITMNKNYLGKMSCNPAIGGLAKGHLVKEVDALGGIMGELIDITGIHFKILNKSKGPAVWSPRAQADRNEYTKYASRYMQQIPNLTIIEAMATGAIVKKSKICGVEIKLKERNERIECKALIVTAGTFLNGLIHLGLTHMESGRAGEYPAKGLTESLVELGFEYGRLKTGTPPRVDINSIDFSKTEEQEPDYPPVPFSHKTKSIDRKQLSCHITYTNSRTHDFLKEGFDESPLYSGRIKSSGPRYCPSIEDKIVRFADKERHQIFLEPEGYKNPEVYVNGFATSLPERAQIKALKSIPGLENVKILRLGYAIEYDFFPTWQIKYTLETKLVENLYFAGQINGTSGYEEAAAQGLIAGINAALKLQEKDDFILERSEAYIGVLIDDLINKETIEPYRLFTSRAEFRLLLRSDNADLRLMEKGYGISLIGEESLRILEKKKEFIAKLNRKIKKKRVTNEQLMKYCESSAPLTHNTPAKTILKRPEVKIDDLLKMIDEKVEIPGEIKTDVEFNIKFDGYIKRQNDLIEKLARMKHKLIPGDFDYKEITSLSREAIEKLNHIRPHSLGQASRIQGVRQADLTVLMIYLEKKRKLLSSK